MAEKLCRQDGLILAKPDSPERTRVQEQLSKESMPVPIFLMAIMELNQLPVHSNALHFSARGLQGADVDHGVVGESGSFGWLRLSSEAKLQFAFCLLLLKTDPIKTTEDIPMKKVSNQAIRGGSFDVVEELDRLSHRLSGQLGMGRRAKLGQQAAGLKGGTSGSGNDFQLEVDVRIAGDLFCERSQ